MQPTAGASPSRKRIRPAGGRQKRNRARLQTKLLKMFKAEWLGRKIREALHGPGKYTLRETG
jgi:hypothetical protein